MDKTLEYYAQNTDLFFDETVDADVSPLWERFEKVVPGGHVLDLGCGSGRDTKHFLEKGYVVTAIDGSAELCKKATEYTGIEVVEKDFFDIDEEGVYDGIWACASMLHVDRERLPLLIHKLGKALKPGGILYMSFKYGDFDDFRDGRHFTDLDEGAFRDIFAEACGMDQQGMVLDIFDEWKSEDVRRGKNVKWLNEMVKKER